MSILIDEVFLLKYWKFLNSQYVVALRNANGEFLLNGHYQVSVFRQQISIQDTVLEYSGSDHVVERINGTGPIRLVYKARRRNERMNCFTINVSRTDIYLHVLSVGNLYPPDIHYEFMVPAQNVRFGYEASVTNYYWRISERWSECSSLCQGCFLANIFFTHL